MDSTSYKLHLWDKRQNRTYDLWLSFSLRHRLSSATGPNDVPCRRPWESSTRRQHRIDRGEWLQCPMDTLDTHVKQEKSEICLLPTRGFIPKRRRELQTFSLLHKVYYLSYTNGHTRVVVTPVSSCHGERAFGSEVWRKRKSESTSDNTLTISGERTPDCTVGRLVHVVLTPDEDWSLYRRNMSTVSTVSVGPQLRRPPVPVPASTVITYTTPLSYWHYRTPSKILSLPLSLLYRQEWSSHPWHPIPHLLPPEPELPHQTNKKKLKKNLRTWR